MLNSGGDGVNSSPLIVLDTINVAQNVIKTRTIKEMNSHKRAILPSLALAGLILSGCQSNNMGNSVRIDPNQASEANIASLTAVVDKNPNSPEAYNVRGSAYGKGR